MFKIGDFNIFNEYNLLEIDIFGILINKNCIKPTENTISDMLSYSLKNNKKLFYNFDVEMYGSFNSNKRFRSMDIDFRIKVDNPFKEEQLDLLEPLLQKQIDISFNKFQILSDFGIYDFNTKLPKKGQNYLEGMLEMGAVEEDILHPSINRIRFNDKEYKFNNKKFYKNYIHSKRWNLSEKTLSQIEDNQYTLCTKIKSIDDINKLYNESNIQS